MTEACKQSQNARIFVQCWHRLKIPQRFGFRTALKEYISYFIVMALKKERKSSLSWVTHGLLFSLFVGRFVQYLGNIPCS